MNVAVFCGSNIGLNPKFEHEAKKLGKYLANNNHTLVYGGSCIGLMGTVANSVLENQGKAIGVITKNLSKNEKAHSSLNELHITENILQRKEMMEDLADAFIIMPGGYGTMDEFFEVLMYAQLAYHEKPCALLNIDCFFDSLLEFISKMTSESFVKTEHKKMIINSDCISTIFNKFSNYSAPKGKWN